MGVNMRIGVLGAIVALIWVCGHAHAQPAPSSTPITGNIDCSQYQLSGPQTSDELSRAKLCEEVKRLQAEVGNMKAVGPLSLYGQFIVPGLSALIGAIVAFIGFSFQQSFARAQTQKLQQDRLTSLMQGMGSGNPPEQFGAISALLSRAEELRGKRNERSQREFRMLAQILVAVMRAGKLDPAITKYVAEGIVDVFGLRKIKSANGLDESMNLKTYGLSNAKLVDVDWQRVYAAEVDFFKADLAKTTFRSATLTDAIFYEADLTDVVLKGADISGANFTNAKGMETVRFDATTRWNDKTVWPAGFTPPSFPPAA